MKLNNLQELVLRKDKPKVRIKVFHRALSFQADENVALDEKTLFYILNLFSHVEPLLYRMYHGYWNTLYFTRGNIAEAPLKKWFSS